MPRKLYDPDRDYVDTDDYQGPCRRADGPLAEFREELEKLTEAVTKGGNRVLDLVKKHEETLYGNGRVGLTTRIDRLEQTHERGRKWFWAVAAVMLPLLVKAVYEVVAH